MQRKINKNKLQIIADIYFYIIGINLLLVLANKIISEIVNFKEILIVNIALILVSIIAIIFAIKWGVEKALKRNIIQPKEFLKIIVFIAIIPIIFGVLASGWIIYINFENFSNISWYLIPQLLSQFIFFFVSGIFYSIVAYFWFKKLSK